MYKLVFQTRNFYFYGYNGGNTDMEINNIIYLCEKHSEMKRDAEEQFPCASCTFISSARNAEYHEGQKNIQISKNILSSHFSPFTDYFYRMYLDEYKTT